MRRKLLCVILSLCVFALPSCADSGVSSASVSDISSAASETTVPTESETKTEISSETTEITETEITSSVTEETTQSETAETESETTETPAEITETETEISSETTVKTTAETTVPKTEATTVTTTEKQVQVIIPEIKVPLANGTDTASGENAEIDYSCASDGYISAVYTGESSRAKLRITCGDLQYDHDLAADGTREFFPLMGSGSYTVRVYELVSGKSYALAAEGTFDVKIKSATAMYLYPNKYSDFDSSSKCVKKAAELCAGKTEDIDKISAIFSYVAENISYDKSLAEQVRNGLTGYVPDPDSTLAKGKGICFDYSSLMAAMCRSQGIPSRIVIGYAEPDIYHAWNEVYTEETGWITPELYFDEKGYNIADATFYAGNSNKEKIADYISDDSNYSAMYRY